MKSSVIKRVVRFVIILLLGVILAYNSIIIVKSFIEPDKTPGFLGIKTYIIISGSMEPNLRVGDMVIVKEVDESDLNVGDIISYRNGQNIITHRIVGITSANGMKQYVTKGDYNNVEDNVVVTMDSIEGKVIKKLTYLGKIILFMQNKIVIVIMALIAVVYFGCRKKELITDDNEEGKDNT